MNIETVNFLNYEDEELIGRVVAYDRDIGMTIVAENDRDRYLYCLTGPSSQLWRDRWSKESYFDCYDRALERLKTGTFDVREQTSGTIIGSGSTTGKASINSCVFA